MTKQDKDREAFEKWALHEGSYDLSTDRDGDYIKPDTWELHRGWQAARDHYAPKLTEEGFEEVYLIYATTALDLTNGDTREGLKAALRAAGVRLEQDA